MGPQKKRQRPVEGEDVITNSAPGDDVENAEDMKLAAPAPVSVVKQQPSRQLFVRSLPLTFTQESLTELFSRSYPLRHAVLVCDPSTKVSRGYGFVTFADHEDAQRAKEEFNGYVLEGQKLKVELAEHRHRDVENNGVLNGHQKRKSSATLTDNHPAQKRQKVEARQRSKLIVRNLPWSIKEPEQLALHFRRFGKVKQAIIPKRKPGLLAGFGFVVMRGQKNAEKAIEGVNGTEVDSRTVAVDWAVEKNIWEELRNEDQQAGNGEVSDGVMVDETQDISDLSDTREKGSAMKSNSLRDVSSEESDGEDDDLGEHNVESGVPGSARSEDNSTTLFIRNLPFIASDDSLYQHFIQFGPIRYARIVMDPMTERPKGTGFVCFYRPLDAETCLREAPRQQDTSRSAANTKKPNTGTMLAKHSVLQNELADPTGRYTMETRVLQISWAVDRNEAARLTEAGNSFRDHRDRDKRRLYLLSEGTVSSGSPLYKLLPASEIATRETSAKQRRALVQGNPTLHLSLTRLSVRNIPRTITSKELKALARQAVVGFAKDVKGEKRQPLSKEELSRGGEEMKEAEKTRRAKGKGIVKQAKIVFEGREGSKVTEESGAGKSRGYGFIEYTSHRWALMGLRWLNGHTLKYKTSDGQGKTPKSDAKETKKRLIVEFAIENAQVVARRKEKEIKMQGRPEKLVERGTKTKLPEIPARGVAKDRSTRKLVRGVKTRRNTSAGPELAISADNSEITTSQTSVQMAEKEALAKRQRIIAKKRMQRRTRKRGLGA